MERQLRKVGLGLLFAFLAIFVQLNYVQVIEANDIAANEANIRSKIREYSIKRGDILSLDQDVLATSRRTDNELFEFARTYPGGELWGHLTGYYTIELGSDRIEATYNDQLLGEAGVLSIQDVGDRFLGSGEEGDHVRLTVETALQETARDALGEQVGAVVALDPSSGEIRAMWSNPSFDPSRLASQDTDEAQKFFESLKPNSPTSPLANIATSKGYPPGSTFKVITTAAALESGRYDPDSVFEDPDELDLPQTDETLTNFSNTACTGTGQIDLFTALEVSCDTTFGLLGLELFPEIQEMSEALGFNSRLPFDIQTGESIVPDVSEDELPFRAFTGIGQGNVVATPLQMAVVAGAIANGGDVPRPRLVREIIDPGGGIVERFSPETLGRAMSPEVADQVTEMMVAVVEGGTGQTAQIEGVEVAGKTGTAQNVQGEAPHAWFIAFAPADDPQIAVAVLVERGGEFGSEATGGQVAAPIAKAVIEKDRELRGW